MLSIISSPVYNLFVYCTLLHKVLKETLIETEYLKQDIQSGQKFLDRQTSITRSIEELRYLLDEWSGCDVTLPRPQTVQGSCLCNYERDCRGRSDRDRLSSDNGHCQVVIRILRIPNCCKYGYRTSKQREIIMTPLQIDLGVITRNTLLSTLYIVHFICQQRKIKPAIYRLC